MVCNGEKKMGKRFGQKRGLFLEQQKWNKEEKWAKASLEGAN